MHAIEFETTSHQHTIRLPDSVPDGVLLRVLLLSEVPLAKPPAERNIKVLLASVTEGMTESDTERPQDFGREVTEWVS